MKNDDYAQVAGQISQALKVMCDPAPVRPVSGGSINACYQWRTERELLFVKIADRQQGGMLTAEADGLRELSGARAVRVPKVRACGTTSRCAFLAIEWIEARTPTRRSEQQLGERLAQQHRATAPKFGWFRDNTIGRTPQQNDWAEDWPAFYRDRRLAFQLDLAARNGHAAAVDEPGRRLLEQLNAFFSDYRPAASLLHGDLWGGNWLVDENGDSVIFDPAVYFGDREADIAMTSMFGGFGPAFYDAYESAWPLDSGHASRRDLYNLYHVLNHANLFGGGYVHQARDMILRLSAQVRG
jgi:protein-ribulosamine 3-kinase